MPPLEIQKKIPKHMGHSIVETQIPQKITTPAPLAPTICGPSNPKNDDPYIYKKIKPPKYYPIPFSYFCSSFFTYTIYHRSKVRDLVRVWEKRVTWTRCWTILLMSLTMSKTALGCASLSAFCEYFFRSSLSRPNHLATILAASFGSFENTPAPLSTT